jgi:hypothetical protein
MPLRSKAGSSMLSHKFRKKKNKLKQSLLLESLWMVVPKMASFESHRVRPPLVVYNKLLRQVMLRSASSTTSYPGMIVAKPQIW